MTQLFHTTRAFNSTNFRIDFFNGNMNLTPHTKPECDCWPSGRNRNRLRRRRRSFTKLLHTINSALTISETPQHRFVEEEREMRARGREEEEERKEGMASLARDARRMHSLLQLRRHSKRISSRRAKCCSHFFRPLEMWWPRRR